MFKVQWLPCIDIAKSIKSYNDMGEVKCILLKVDTLSYDHRVRVGVE